ncbi:DUF3597 domain-containing protein [Stutzerimonas stutzeri]|uniref:DUF3597 domain-containing protein n=1 Tax=Stutzerimonas stutzeri TaxID=316 RepID=UPI001C2EB515|nr:DUF3597 domain-containing protein [Stutzerimonas stutzeri]
MSLFDKIKDKLGLGGVSNEAHKPVDPSNTPNAHARDTVVDSERPTAAHNATTTPPGAAPSLEAGGSPTAAVDVPAKLDAMAANHPEKLNWRTSIVDLLKLLGLDSSLESRKELATELGCPQDKLADSAQMNIWLHRTVMHKLAEHGGTVPPELRT